MTIKNQEELRSKKEELDALVKKQIISQEVANQQLEHLRTEFNLAAIRSVSYNPYANDENESNIVDVGDPYASANGMKGKNMMVRISRSHVFTFGRHELPPSKEFSR